MPRAARAQSDLNLYHVIICGNDEEICEEVCELREMKRIVEEKLMYMPEVSMCAYCMMKNHAHFLLHADLDSVATFIRRITTSYAYYFNERHGQRGHVFQERYQSEPIQSEKAYWDVVRHIHNHPVRAGLSNHLGDYNWSSAHGYLEGEDALLCMEAFARYEDKFPDQAQFVHYHRIQDFRIHMDISQEQEIQRKELIMSMITEQMRLCGCKAIEEFSRYDITYAKAVAYVLRNTNLSIRDVGHDLGLSIRDVQHLLKRSELREAQEQRLQGQQGQPNRHREMQRNQ